MSISTASIRINTRGNSEIIDITRQIADQIKNSTMDDGIVTIFISGSTAGITTIEYEGGLISDFREMWDRNIPQDISYQHNQKWGDGNGHSHIRASTLGASLVVPFTNKTMTLGTWQQIILVDFDNRPRTRDIVIQLIGE